MLDSHAEASYLISAIQFFDKKSERFKIRTGDATIINKRNLPV